MAVSQFIGVPEGAADAALDAVIMQDLNAMGGDGGVVILASDGPHWAFNTAGMYRASWTPDSEPVVSIFGDEE